MGDGKADTNEQPPEPKLVQVAHWLNDHWPRIVSAVGTIAIAACGVWFSVKGKDVHWCAWPVFGISVAGWLTGEFFNWCRQERLSGLLKQLLASEKSRLGLEETIERTSQDYFALFHDQLSLLANDVFAFSDKERISVYKHDGTAFVMLGRYSKNPDYSKKGRAMYPDNEGCIARAWKEGEAVIEDLPDPATDMESYMTKNKNEWGINKQVSKAFSMKSRSYVALAIEHRSQNERIAVVVFESVRANGALDKEKIKSLLNSHEGKRIAQFLDRMRSLEPTPTYAHREGF